MIDPSIDLRSLAAKLRGPVGAVVAGERPFLGRLVARAQDSAAIPPAAAWLRCGEGPRL